MRLKNKTMSRVIIGVAFIFCIIQFIGCGGDSSSPANLATDNPPQSNNSDTEQPSQPTGLQAQTITSNSISLSWNASTDNIGVAGYDIFRCRANSCGSVVQLGPALANAYTDTGLSPNTEYLYTVRAYDAAKNYSWESSVASITTSP